jgi:predicted cupin superfamily sugar epimerase
VDALQAARTYGLEPHPEGGFYRETYRSPLGVTPDGWPGERSLATAILYLLPAGARSAWHRVRGEELWLWQGGAPMTLTVRSGEGGSPGPAIDAVVGPDAAAGQVLQALVPAGLWQSATPADGEPQWSLVACVVAPGFDFADFELRDAG